MTAYNVNLQQGDTLTVTASGGAPVPPTPGPGPTPIPPTPTPEPVPGDVTVIQATWGTIDRFLTANYAAFKCNPFAVQFTVPGDAVNDGKSRKISVSESNGPPTLRHMVLSETCGDFGPGLARQYGVQTTIDLAVGAGGGSYGLVAGRTYFMNFRNYSPDTPGCTCSVDSCNASVDCVW